MSEPVRARLRALVIAGVLTLAVAPAAHAGKPAAGGGKSDKTAPTVAVTFPTAASRVDGSITLSGGAADNVALSRVDVSVDGGAFTTATGTVSWSRALDTTTLADGTHTVTARATDTSGNAALSTVSFSVSNISAPSDAVAPKVAIATPGDGTNVARQISVAGSASDDAGLSKVEVKLDGGAYQAASGTSSWSAVIEAAGAADGAHVITVRATDTSGQASSTSVGVKISDTAVTAPAMASGTIGGFAFQEQDRDGVFETTDRPLGNVYVSLYDAAGTFVRNALVDASGWFAFTGLADGQYRVQVAPADWVAYKYDWVADTSSSIVPSRPVTLAGTARADLGTRPIVRSPDASAPISAYTGASGLTVKSYDDAVSAKEVYDRLMTGALIGVEAKYVTIRFDYAKAGVTYAMAVQSNGVYTDFRATSDLTWAGWLRGDGELFHEYGHAWSLYFTDMVQNDPTLKSYLHARGLDGDSRVGTSYAWDPKEMIAEDYRELFGTPSAQGDTQINRDVPLAKDVPGLKEFLSGTFMQMKVL